MSEYSIDTSETNTLRGGQNVNEIFVKNHVFSHRCDQAGENGITRLASVRCPNGLAFDIERQTCDWKTNVKNCDKIESKYYCTVSETSKMSPMVR
jgi:hypothetical protein